MPADLLGLMIVNHLLTEDGLLALAQVGIAGAEEAADDLFLIFNTEILDHFISVLSLHDLLYPLEGSGIGSHQGVGGADREVHRFN